MFLQQSTVYLHAAVTPHSELESLVCPSNLTDRMTVIFYNDVLPGRKVYTVTSSELQLNFKECLTRSQLVLEEHNGFKNMRQDCVMFINSNENPLEIGAHFNLWLQNVPFWILVI